MHIANKYNYCKPEIDQYSEKSRTAHPPGLAESGNPIIHTAPVAFNACKIQYLFGHQGWIAVRSASWPLEGKLGNIIVILHASGRWKKQQKMLQEKYNKFKGGSK